MRVGAIHLIGVVQVSTTLGATSRAYPFRWIARIHASAPQLSDHFTVTDGGETIAVVPRTTAREISRCKAYATQRSRGGEQHFGPR